MPKILPTSTLGKIHFALRRCIDLALLCVAAYLTWAVAKPPRNEPLPLLLGLRSLWVLVPYGVWGLCFILWLFYQRNWFGAAMSVCHLVLLGLLAYYMVLLTILLSGTPTPN